MVLIRVRPSTLISGETVQSAFVCASAGQAVSSLSWPAQDLLVGRSALTEDRIGQQVAGQYLVQVCSSSGHAYRMPGFFSGVTRKLLNPGCYQADLALCTPREQLRAHGSAERRSLGDTSPSPVSIASFDVRGALPLLASHARCLLHSRALTETCLLCTGGGTARACTNRANDTSTLHSRDSYVHARWHPGYASIMRLRVLCSASSAYLQAVLFWPVAIFEAQPALYTAWQVASKA